MFSRCNYCACYLIFAFLIINEIFVDSIQIRVENRGGYIARILIRYHNSKNEEQLHTSGGLSSFQSSTINIENNVKSIEIEVQLYAFINSLRTIFKTTNPCPHTRCFVICGTIFKADWNEIFCAQ
ncbi:unnamed protein product [Adineta steineri]|uniref:Uncharacterized protein n=1 Tax=Adineta steineri TaxID=433720 RepID=A0A818LWV0_9BILA|nr:unnamed protein product [Adineta steineri]CAF3575783.1 unnamed protein product [Adineta steineri]